MPGRRFFSAGVLWSPKNTLKLTVYNQKSDRAKDFIRPAKGKC